MTAPRVCEYCGACLDAGEKCDCGGEHRKPEIRLSWRKPRADRIQTWDAARKAPQKAV